MIARTLHAMLLLSLSAATVHAAEPAIRNIDIRGLRVAYDPFGTTCTQSARKQWLRRSSTAVAGRSPPSSM